MHMSKTIVFAVIFICLQGLIAIGEAGFGLIRNLFNDAPQTAAAVGNATIVLFLPLLIFIACLIVFFSVRNTNPNQALLAAIVGLVVVVGCYFAYVYQIGAIAKTQAVNNQVSAQAYVTEKAAKLAAMQNAIASGAVINDEAGLNSILDNQVFPEAFEMYWAAGRIDSNKIVTVTINSRRQGEETYTTELPLFADPNLNDNTNSHLSGQYADMTPLDLFLGANADVNFAEKVHKKTPLIIAVNTGNDLSLAVLLKHGASASMKDDTGKSALDYFIEYYPDVVSDPANAGSVYTGIYKLMTQ